MKASIDYIIRFLIGDSQPEELYHLVGYTSDKEEYSSYKIVIKPSGFFDEDIYGTKASLPSLPLQFWEETPILFGNNKEERIYGTLVLHADIIASTYFLITRYEEMIRREDRDKHQRFPGKKSLPYRANFINLPIIEMWGNLLRSKMKEMGLKTLVVPQTINKVYLTHDVDYIAHFRNFRGMAGGLLRGLKLSSEAISAVKSYLFGIKYDPWFTFPYFFELAENLQKVIGKEKVESIVFLRSHSSERPEDLPKANLKSTDYRYLIRYIKDNQHSMGLHASYAAGCNPERLTQEKLQLEQATKSDIHYNRNHFLNNREPEDFEHLIQAGITDDFTMGYADVAGFRLGTCRAVRWINPATKKLTDLILHPLNIMDISLSDARYMHLNEEQALAYGDQIIKLVREHNGDLCLLWHNNSVDNSNQSYHRSLYTAILNLLAEAF